MDLGGIGAWGTGTGVGLDADGRSLVLGQRSAKGEERLVEVQLDCEEQGVASR